jgi:hypothetical protein
MLGFGCPSRAEYRALFDFFHELLNGFVLGHCSNLLHPTSPPSVHSFAQAQSITADTSARLKLISIMDGKANLLILVSYSTCFLTLKKGATCPSELHGVTTRNASLFKVTAGGISNPKCTVMFSYNTGSHFISMVEWT